MISSLGAEPDQASAGPGPTCLDDLAATAFVEGTCAPARRTEILEHLETCTACKELVAGVVDIIKSSDTLLATPDAAGAGSMTAPAMIGTYRLGPQIAQGGMGRIYRAFDTTLNRDVALKLPRSGNDALARRFEREAAITARLEHPGIVPIHGAGQTPEGTPFYVMRFIDGRSLDHLIAEAATPEARLALVDRVLDVARTMAYVHGKRIVHRDLKPNNILVGAFDETLIIDWGLAKQLSDARASLPAVPPDSEPPHAPIATRVGEVMGTPSFMPPEQAAGESVDERADVYALGAILRNVLSGTLPRHADDEIPGPAAVVDVCRRAMQWERDDRYSDAGEFASALDAAVARTRPKPPRPPLVWLAAGAVVVAAAIAAVLVLAPRDTAHRIAAHAITRQPSDALYISLSPSGKLAAVGGRERFQILDIATGKTWARNDWLSWPWILEFESDDVVRYSASFDGQQSTLVRWDLRTDSVERFAPFTVSEEGYWLGSLAGGASLYAPRDNAPYFEVRRGTERTRLPSDSLRQLRVFSIAPTRDRVAFVDYTSVGSVIRICDLTGGTFTSPVVDDIAAMSWLDDKTLLYTTGTTDGSTLWRALATQHGLAMPARMFDSARGGWLGTLASRAGHVIASWITSSYETRLYSRSNRTDTPLNKTVVSAALVWLDDTTYLAYSNGSGLLERHSTTPRVLPQVTALRLPGEPINATRAGDLVIVALRANAGRSVVASALSDSTVRWTAPAGALVFVRCAGDRQAPCIAGQQDATSGLIRLVSIDPQTGALGHDVIGEGVIIDAAVSGDGSEVSWIVEYRAVYSRPFDRSAPERVMPTLGAGNHSLAYDLTGGLLATGASMEGRRIVRYAGDTETTELTAGGAILTLVRPSPDGEYILYRARTLNADLVEIR